MSIVQYTEMTSLWAGGKLQVAIILGLIIAISLLSSLWLFALADPSVEFITTQDAIRLGWTDYCWPCETYRPSGAAHCHDCKRCIRNHEQHFGLGVNCVGAGTANFYTAFFVSLFLASLYANFVSIDTLLGLTMKFNATLAFSVFVPLVAWAFGIIDEDFGVALNAMIILFSLLYSCVRLYQKCF